MGAGPTGEDKGMKGIEGGIQGDCAGSAEDGRSQRRKRRCGERIDRYCARTPPPAIQLVKRALPRGGGRKKRMARIRKDLECAPTD